MDTSFDGCLRLLRMLLLIAAIPAFASAEEARIPLSQAANAVERLISQGEFAAAREVAVAAVKTDPTNPVFLIALARADTALGNVEEAIAAGQAAWRNARTDDTRFLAARTVAKAQFDAGQFTRSQIWLRRARQYAPNAETSNRVAEDYRVVSARNPWSTSLRFGVMPSSNINDGSSQRTTLLFGLPFEFELSGDARALSGLEISAGFDTRYRVYANETSATFLSASVDATSYVLSKAAQEQAPDVRGSDYSSRRLSYGVSHRHVFVAGSLPTDFSIIASSQWRGGKLSSRTVDTTVRQSWELGAQDGISLAFSNQNLLSDGRYSDGTAPLANQLIKSHAYGFAASWSHVFESGNRASLQTNVRKSTSLAPDSDYKSVTVGARYDFAEPIYGMRFGFGVSREVRNFDGSIYTVGPREDKSVTLDMSVNFANVEYYGFQPVVNLQARRNDSSIDLFDRDYTSIGFDLRSSF